MTEILDITRRWLDVLPEGRFEEFPDGISPAKGRSSLVLSDVVSLKTEDPELVMTTARGSATMANGRLYENSYVMLTRIRDGMVIEHTEYLNPLAVMATYAD